jgi:hypothetical protein
MIKIVKNKLTNIFKYQGVGERRAADKGGDNLRRTWISAAKVCISFYMVILLNLVILMILAFGRQAFHFIPDTCLVGW